MTVLQTIGVAFSMFSAIPMPQFPWENRNMRYALCAFPLIGLVIGLLCWGFWAVGAQLGLPRLLTGAFLTLIPVWITGGIHLDGFADTCDALSSHGDPNRMREIMKDPHLGAFAAIRLCGYFVLTLALWTALPYYQPIPLLLGFCLSRVQSGLSVAAFPLAKNTGLAYTFSTAADRGRVKTVLITLDAALSLGLCLCGVGGGMMTAVAHGVFFGYYRTCERKFGGLSGDLAGWYLVREEQWMLLALVLWEYVEAFL